MSTNSFSIFTSALSLFTHNTNENNADYYRALDELKPKRTLPILSWIEKIVIIIDYLQIFGILWITAQPWPWPFQWSLYTRPLLYINLDFFSAYNEEGALAGRSNITSSRWGQMENYWLYVAIFTGVQFFFYLLIYCKYLYIKLFSYGKKISVQLDYCKAVGLAASLLLFVPCTLTVFRLFYCEYNTNTSNKINNLHNYYLSADPAIECLGTTHIVLLTVCTFLNTIVMVTLPTMMYKIVNKNLIYADKNDHEKRVQMWELLYIYDISNTWIKQQQWIMSSFTLAGSYYYIHLFIYKLLLLLTFALIRSDFIAQSLAFVFITSTFCCYYMFINRPFRSIVSNIILVITLALQIFNSVFGMCNSFGVRNAVMVSSTQSVVLGAYNMISFMCIAVVLVYMYLSSIPDWPAMKTIKRIRNNKYHTVKVIKWIEVMRESVTIKNDFIASPIEIADINNLEDIIRLLRQCLLQAKANGSIFETPISDILEELLLIHSTHHKHALRRFNYWDTEYSAIDKDSNLVKRTNNYVLMTPAKRKILTKLLAYRFLKGTPTTQSY